MDGISINKLSPSQASENNNIHTRSSKLDALLKEHLYKDASQASKIIDLIQELIGDTEDQRLQILFHTRKANVCNQLYQYDEALLHFQKVLPIVDVHADIKEQAEIHIDHLGVLINKEKFDACEVTINKVIQLLKAAPDDLLNARLLTREGSIALNKDHFDKAITLFNEAEKIFSEHKNLSIKDSYFQAILQSGLGSIYDHNGDIENSLNAYKRVLEISEAKEIHGRLSWHYLHTGLACMKLENFEKAKMYFEKSIEINDDNSKPARAGAYANLGYCFFVKDNYKNALYYYDTAEEIYKELNKEDHVNLFYIQLWKSQAFAKLGNQKRESDHLLAAYELAKKSGNNKILLTVFSNIASFYAERGEFELAYKYQQMHTNYSEEYFEELRSQQITELNIKYNTEKSEREAEVLKLESNRLQLKALRAQMNPHFIHNALNSIQHFINTNEKETAGKYLAQFANLMRNSLYYSDQESISLEEEVEFLKEYLDINKKLRYSDQMTFKIEVDDELEEDLICLPSMIVQPYVENALEHGIRTRDDGEVKISFKDHDDETIKCIIEDNGIGREMAMLIQQKGGYHEKHRSMGTAITQKRLEVLKSSINNKNLSVNIIDLKDDTGQAKGTRVELLIPILEFKYK